MLITRETDYAIRIVRNLSYGSFKNIRDVADRENISLGMAHKVCRRLVQHEVIESERGIAGGYALCKPSNETTLFDIFVAMNETTAINRCLVSPEQCTFAIDGTCKVHRELQRIQDMVNAELNSITIEDISKN